MMSVYSIDAQRLEFELLQVADLNVADVAVDVDDDGDRHGRLGRRDADGEHCEEEAFELSREEEAVEDGEVDVGRIEDQLHGDEHRQQVAAREESVDAREHHDGAQHQIVFHSDFHNDLSFACDHDSAHDAGQQQQADGFEGEDVSVFAAAEQRVADLLDIQLARKRTHCEEPVFERDEEAERQPRERGAQPREELAPPEPVALAALHRGQQDREDVEHRDAAGIDQELHRPQKGVVELEVDARRAEEHDQQVGRRAQNPPCRNGEDREDDHHCGHEEKNE